MIDIKEGLNSMNVKYQELRRTQSGFRTMSDVAQILGFSRQRADQLFKSAIIKLRKRAAKDKDYLLSLICVSENYNWGRTAICVMDRDYLVYERECKDGLSKHSDVNEPDENCEAK